MKLFARCKNLIVLSKEKKQLHTQQPLSLMEDTELLLQIEPSELTFHLELAKLSSCSVKLANQTTHYVAFKVLTTRPKKYCVIPNVGIIAPQETCEVTVTTKAPRTAPIDFECKDKFLIQSRIVSPDDILLKSSGGGRVEEKELNVVFLPPKVDLELEEDSSNSNPNPIHVQNEDLKQEVDSSHSSPNHDLKQEDYDSSNSNPIDVQTLKEEELDPLNLTHVQTLMQEDQDSSNSNSFHVQSENRHSVYSVIVGETEGVHVTRKQDTTNLANNIEELKEDLHPSNSNPILMQSENLSTVHPVIFEETKEVHVSRKQDTPITIPDIFTQILKKLSICVTSLIMSSLLPFLTNVRLQLVQLTLQFSKAIWMRIIQRMRIFVMNHSNDVAQVNLAKNIEELEKDVEKLKSNISAISIGFTECNLHNKDQ
ncbi:vesicle-associated protein 1-2-like [Lotus japonicus]|uniref:vesicle-associated protein 1-2-like n=1 Tax=Lotus japonicus TaxID=34305 RepID=UPI00259099A7|nr:vesicle-associated protein 1-2-like [Lotus japonicus]